MPLNNWGIISPSIAGRGALYRSAQPDREGLRTMSNLRIYISYRLSHSEEGGVSLGDEQLWFKGMVYRDEYKEILRFGEDQKVYETASVINNFLSMGHNVLVHCATGRDRTGLAIAAWQLLYDGKTLEQVESLRDLYGVHGLISWIDYPDQKILEHIAKGVKK